MEVPNQVREAEIPVYECKRDGMWLFFYCHVCDADHAHPAGDYLNPGERAHRVAHCRTEAGKAFHKGGYYIYWGVE